MCVRRARRIVRAVLMLVVRIVVVPVLVLCRFVDVFMVVPLGQMEPQTKPHQSTREQQFNG